MTPTALSHATRCLSLLSGLTLGLGVLAPALACETRTVARQAGAAEIGAFVRERQRSVLTFVGNSGSGYEDPAAMLAQADAQLASLDPAATMINIGATVAGIGAVYELARQRGFITLGIVSSLARDEGAALSPCVDWVFFVADTTWGGRLPGSTQLSPTSAAIVANSQVIVGIGGGEIARDEMLAARAAGKEVHFFAADMNHRIAIDKARAKGWAAPADFRGAADEAFAGRSGQRP